MLLNKTNLLKFLLITLFFIFITRYAFTQDHPQWPGLEEAKKANYMEAGWYKVTDAKTMPQEWSKFIFANTTSELNTVKNIIFSIGTISIGTTKRYSGGSGLRYEVYGRSFASGSDTVYENTTVTIYPLNYPDNSQKVLDEYQEALKSAKFNVGGEYNWQENWNKKLEKVDIDKDCQGYIMITAPKEIKFREAPYRSSPIIPGTSEGYVLLYKNYIIYVSGDSYNYYQDINTSIFKTFR
ncbi:MAG: hypothetical protein HYU63_07995 [Armatimonadetes bacterium]|nr:hypothetical protein [Armatimonadota bacterium]